MKPFLSQTTDNSNDKVMTNTTVMRISPQWAVSIPHNAGQPITWDGQLAPTIPFHCSPFTVHHSEMIYCMTCIRFKDSCNNVNVNLLMPRCQKHSCIPMLHQRASPARYNYALSASTFSPSRVILHLFPLASYYLLLPTSHLVTSHIRGTWTAQKHNYSVRYTAALLVIC